MDINKTHVSVERLNWNVEYLYDIINGKGFTITMPPKAPNSDDEYEGLNTRSLYGSRSPLYGEEYTDEDSFIGRYHCQCGSFTGAQFKDEICPMCGTPVRYNEANIEYTGWITLFQYSILSPYYYKLISDAIGKKVLKDLLQRRNVVDKNGIISKAKNTDSDTVPESPFSGIGFIEFQNRFEEVMLYFKSKKKNKAAIIDSIIAQKELAFVSKIPIFSTLLRPESVTSDTHFFNSIDRQVAPLYSISEKLLGATPVDIEMYLSRIQYRVNELWKLVFDLLRGKTGFIRDQILGGSLNYTARNVIIPDPTLKDNEIDVSYHTFRDKYKNQIIHYLMSRSDMTLAKAYQMWAESFVFDPKIYSVMCALVEQYHPKEVINRNPTLNYYSIAQMTIRKVKRSDQDYTLSLPLSILPGFNADFDGDVLNNIGMMLKEIEHIFDKFNPITQMIIARDTGKLNPYYSLVKGTVVNIHYFAVIDIDEYDEYITDFIDELSPEDKLKSDSSRFDMFIKFCIVNEYVDCEVDISEPEFSEKYNRLYSA